MTFIPNPATQQDFEEVVSTPIIQSISDADIEAVIKIFRSKFSKQELNGNTHYVEIEIDDKEPNGAAKFARIVWIDTIGNDWEWKILLYEGLTKNAEKIEVIYLALAHELGHIYGDRDPKYLCKATHCAEGEADYAATRTVLPIINADADWLKNIAAVGGEELKKICEKIKCPPGIPKPPKCSHPPMKCRLKTFMDGAEKKTKPSCAGVPIH